MKKNTPPKRPFLLKVMTFCLFIITISGTLRLYGTVTSWNLLSGLGLPVSPLYLAVYGGIQTVAALIGCLGLWFRQRWSLTYNLIFLPLILLWYWLDRLLLTRSEIANENLLFTVIAMFIFLIFSMLSLSWLKKHYFNQQSEKSKHEFNRTGT
jgi:hypothetical protein